MMKKTFSENLEEQTQNERYFVFFKPNNESASIKAIYKNIGVESGFDTDQEPSIAEKIIERHRPVFERLAKL